MELEEKVQSYIKDIAHSIRIIRINQGINLSDIKVSNKTILGFEVNHNSITLNKLFTILSTIDKETDYKLVLTNMYKYVLNLLEKSNISVQDIKNKLHLKKKVLKKNDKLAAITLEVYIKLCLLLGANLKDICGFGHLNIENYSDTFKLDDYDGPVFNESHLSLKWGEPNSCKRTKITYVIDGDTYKVNTSRSSSRMLIIDTPECTKKVQVWGITSKLYFEKLISKYSNDVIMQVDNVIPRKDKYNRNLVYTWINVNGTYMLLEYIMLYKGYANLRYEKDRDSSYIDYLKRAENIAINDKRVIHNYKLKDVNWDYYKVDGNFYYR